MKLRFQTAQDLLSFLDEQEQHWEGNYWQDRYTGDKAIISASRATLDYIKWLRMHLVVEAD